MNKVKSTKIDPRSAKYARGAQETEYTSKDNLPRKSRGMVLDGRWTALNGDLVLNEGRVCLSR